MSQVTCEKEVDAASQVPRGTCRELSSLILALVRLDATERMDFDSFRRSPFTKASYIWFSDP